MTVDAGICRAVCGVNEMIFISDDLIKKIKAEGSGKYPHECCGFIYGRLLDNGEKYAESIEAVDNSFNKSEQYHRYMISSEDMMRAEIYARKNSLDIVGFYHSHPDCAAIPSGYDRNHALPVYSYVIISVVDKIAADVQSWVLRTDNAQFENELLDITDYNDI